MTKQRTIDPDAGERTPERDQRIRTLRLVSGDSERAQVLWQQATTSDDWTVRKDGSDGR